MIRVGVIGGGLGLRCLIPKFNEIPEVTVVAFMSGHYRKALEEAHRYHIRYVCRNIEEMCELPLDLICVASPTEFHYEQISYIVKKNRNILCEKPLALTLEESNQIIDLFKSTQNIALIDLELRFHPYFAKIKELLMKSGRVYHIDIFFHSNIYQKEEIQNSWNYSVEKGGGIRLAMMPHLLDLLFFWIDKDCISMRSYLAAVANHSNVSDFCYTSLELEDGITASLSASAVVEGDKNIEIRILTSEGMIEFDLQSGLQINKNPVDVPLPDFFNSEESFFRSSFACYARAISQMLKCRGTQFDITTEDQMKKIHVILNDIKLSANTGKEIKYQKTNNNNNS